VPRGRMKGRRDAAAPSIRAGLRNHSAPRDHTTSTRVTTKGTAGLYTNLLLFFWTSRGMKSRVYEHGVCGARTRSGTPCRHSAMPITRRCHLHGGRAGRPRGIPEHPASRLARPAGRQRWVERMRLAKAQGLIEKFPNGRKPGVRIGVRDRVRSPDPSAGGGRGWRKGRSRWR
jgi:hypothetical protein